VKKRKNKNHQLENDEQRAALGVQSYGISITTLEEVFSALLVFCFVIYC
jgi:hypothetical protein